MYKLDAIKVANKLEQVKIEKIRQKMFESFRNVPPEGKVISYLRKKFKVYASVFWPHDDSKAIIKNYKINQGDSVLDVCTGSGVLAVFSALRGASKVVALDINPTAIRATKENAKEYKVDGIIEARVSNLLQAIKKGETFDVVTINPPFTRKKASDLVEATVYADSDFQMRFLKGVKKHLNPNARIYMSQANFGAIKELIKLAEENGFLIQEIGEYQKKNNPRVFYAFELKVNKCVKIN